MLIKTKTSGTNFITMKQCQHLLFLFTVIDPLFEKYIDNAKTGKKNKNTKEEETENTCLIRATVGDEKISTIVRHKDLNKFQIAYLNLLKTNMANSLQKRTTKKIIKN